MIVSIPERHYPRVKRVLYRWIRSAYFREGKAHIEFRWRP